MAYLPVFCPHRSFQVYRIDVMTKSTIRGPSHSNSDCDARGAVRVVSHCGQRHEEMSEMGIWNF